MEIRRSARDAAIVIAIVAATAFGQPPQSPSPQFGVAAIRASQNAGARILQMQGGFYRGGRYEVRNARVVDLIGTAWNIDPGKVTGGPAWILSDRFDITAKAPDDSDEETLRLMLRTLLADRFQLTVHNEDKPLTAYVLTAGTKTKMKSGDSSGDSGCRLAPSVNRSGPGVSKASGPDGTNLALNEDLTIPYICSNITMATFSEALPNMAFTRPYLNGVQVVDRTGLNDAFSFELKYTVNSMAAKQFGLEVVTLADAIEKQLGLKLELTKIPLSVIAVDRVSKPASDAPAMTRELPAAPTRFEVADIKPSDPNSSTPAGSRPFQPGGRLTLRSYTLRKIIQLAWNIEDIDALIAGPKFLDSARFDILARASTVSTLAGPGQPAVESLEPESLRLMLQNLLRDRFGLVAHFEDRPVSGYVLTAVKPKLKAADAANQPGCHEGPGPDGSDPRISRPEARRLVTCLNVTMAQFAGELRGQAMAYLREYPPVSDETGLDGVYDITLNFSQLNDLTGNNGRGPLSQNPGGNGEASDPGGGISLFDALQKQLGLRLEMRKHPVRVLVIDHISEKPTGN